MLKMSATTNDQFLHTAMFAFEITFRHTASSPDAAEWKKANQADPSMPCR